MWARVCVQHPPPLYPKWKLFGPTWAAGLEMRKKEKKNQQQQEEKKTTTK